MAIWFSELMFFHDEEERDYYAAVGMYLKTWAGMEFGLAILIHNLRDHCGADVLEKEAPRSLKRRLAFLRRAASLPVFTNEDRQGILRTCDWIAAEASFRHDLSHGQKINFRKSKPFFALMQRHSDASKSPLEGDVKKIDKAEVVRHYDILNNAVAYNTLILVAKVGNHIIRQKELAIERLLSDAQGGSSEMT